MRTKDLALKTDWIRTNSLFTGWFSNGQMWRRHEIKDGDWHGGRKVWRMNGSVWLHDVWENGRVVKKIA